MSRTLNFYAGPSVLPVAVLEEVRDQLLDYYGTGLSIGETSHRAKAYDEIHTKAIALLRELLSVPDNYQVLLLGGGATLQFSMVPLNFLTEGRRCDFTVTGFWSKKACSDAEVVGSVRVVFDGAQDKFTKLPDPQSLDLDSQAAYVHLTSNETIEGLQWKNWPKSEAPLICDMSSDILSRPVPVEKFGLIYAGAQKNLGPSGVTVVIVRDDLLERPTSHLPAYLRYQLHAQKGSLYNTPPVLPIYMVKLVLEGVKKSGGISAVTSNNEKKAALLYSAIDESGGFYHCPVEPAHRSQMNVAFRLPSKELDERFVGEAAQQQMVGLKGHRSVGGCRASIYNSMTYEGVQTLVNFMRHFAQKNG